MIFRFIYIKRALILFLILFLHVREALPLLDLADDLRFQLFRKRLVDYVYQPEESLVEKDKPAKKVVLG